MTKGKKIAAAIAAAAVAVITSVSAFAVTNSYTYNYNLSANGSVKKTYDADYDYMYFNTRPSSPGPVHLTVTGSGLPKEGVGTSFPAQVSRSPLKISTVQYEDYDIVLSAEGYATSGILYVKTSTDPNLSF